MYTTRGCTPGVPTVYPYPQYPWLTQPEGRRVRVLTGTGTGQPGITRGLPVLIPTREPKKMEFLFVRWFGVDNDEIGGWRTKKLHQIGFVEGDSDQAFGFVDPADIIRGVHLIPRFSLGRTKELLDPSFARSAAENDEDWVRYYVNMYVDEYFIRVLYLY